MTSEDIKRTMIQQGDASSTHETQIIYAQTVWLAEIAYQLAVMNERAARPEELELAKLQRGGNQP